MTITNPILATDSYKFSHFMQYPKGAQYVSSYVEARGTKIDGVTEVVMFGLQSFIKEVLMKPVTRKHVEEARDFCARHGVPFNFDGWMIIVNDHNGYIPVHIDAVPEGTPVPLHNMMIQVINTDPRLPWITSYIETLLISYVWYGSTVATCSREMKKIIRGYLKETSDNADAELPFNLHDFGYRGVAAGAAGLGAAAHLVNFMGTDTVAGIEHAMKFYDSDMCGFSISASEHSTMTSWGRDGEFDAYRNMVDAYAKPGAVFACVIDSYDTMAAIDMWTNRGVINPVPSLLDRVAEAGAVVTLRPDSGDPVQMPIDVICKLMDKVGYTVNSKGFKVLPDHVRVIQGDGIDIDDIRAILHGLYQRKISASNIVFGMGGGLLQKVNRDTFKFAMKANAIMINGAWRDVVKDPITDKGKKSKAGRQDLLVKDGKYITVREDEAPKYIINEGYSPAMNVVYMSNKGIMNTNFYTFDEVRANAAV